MSRYAPPITNNNEFTSFSLALASAFVMYDSLRKYVYPMECIRGYGSDFQKAYLDFVMMLTEEEHAKFIAEYTKGKLCD